MVTNPLIQDKKEQTDRILNMYGYDKSDSKTATLITKSDFQEAFPEKFYSFFKLEGLHSFRKAILADESISDKDGAFKKAVDGLRPFVVVDSGKKSIVFVKKKEVEEVAK